jgi:DNA-binding transcriptional LysR family regulator
MIDRYQLRYFLAVADHGNFSRAAAHCNVAQPTLSVGIAKLEKDLGTQLFIRNSRRVQLTGAGARFLSHARSIENEFNLAMHAASERQGEPMLRLGLLRSVPFSLIAQAMAALQTEAPDAMVELVEGTQRELANALTRGRVDCALMLTGTGSDRFEEEPLFGEGYALALPRSHPAAQADMVEADQVAQDVMFVRRHCEVLSETSRFFTQRGVRPHFAFRSNNDERMLQLVASGLGITLMPECYRSGEVAMVPMRGFDHRRTIGLARIRGSQGGFDHPAIGILRRQLGSGA